jgi:TPP-dependent indolepyruvate ferredoxin oxidoreductase alpha subunit
MSTELHVPVVLRLTSRLLLYERGAIRKESGALPPARPFDPKFWLTDAEGQRRRLLEATHSLADAGAAMRRRGDGRLRVIGCGDPVAAALASTGLETLAIRRVHPLPEGTIVEFLAGDDRPVLVLEDGGTVIEDAARANSQGHVVLGRRTGHVLRTGIIDVPASVEAATAGRPVAKAPLQVVEGNAQANLKPYGTIWRDAADLGLAPVAVDAGNCSAAVWQPGYPAPFCVGLGSAVGVAAGVAQATKRPALAVAGDMATFHAGILGLLQVVRDQLPVITFVCDDGSASYTGGQPNPGSDPGPHQRQVGLVEMARGIGIDLVETIPQDRMQSEVLRPLLRRLMDARRPSLVVIDAR